MPIDLVEAFTRTFQAAPDGGWFPPGRINIIGEHTDYNGGFVLPAAIAQGATAYVRRRSDDLIRVHAADLEETREVGLREVAPAADLGWAAYIAGVGWAAAQRGLDVPGIDLAVSSNVPVGAGLSSSAALSCVSATAWNDLAGWGLSRCEIADLGRDAENHIAGAPTGVMDQLASACGRAGHLLKIDTRSMAVEEVPFAPDAHGLAVLVVDSRTPHTHADGEYAERRASCHRAAEALRVQALRDISIDDLDTRLAGLPDLLRKRARHVITDSHRVQQVVALLRDGGDLRRIGPLLNDSHASMRDDFEITVPTVDLLQEVLVANGAHGARMTGGGFGGCVIALVDHQRTDSIAASCVAAAERAGHPKPTSFVAHIADGARRVATRQAQTNRS